jgi:hypothetical protein
MAGLDQRKEPWGKTIGRHFFFGMRNSSTNTAYCVKRRENGQATGYRRQKQPGNEFAWSVTQQSVSKCVCHSLTLLDSHTLNNSITQSLGQWFKHSASQSVSHSDWESHSITQPDIQSVTLSVIRSVTTPLIQSFGQLFSQSLCQ